jgi:F-type H+-transporting ATPase subunit b
MSLLHDSTFWVLCATVLFGLIIWKRGRQPILSMLDARTDRIRQDLEEAAILRQAAQELLEDIRQKHGDAVSTSKKIIDNAKESALRMERESDAKLAEMLARREELLLQRISRAEAAAVQEIREQAADIATKAAETLLGEMMPKRGAKLVEDSITDISSAKLN